VSRSCFSLLFVVLICKAGAQITPISLLGSVSPVVAVDSQVDLAQVPLTLRLIGKLKTAGGIPGGTAHVTFSIFSEEDGGVPLWSEGADVQLDGSGRYTVVLGRMPNFLPLDIFVSGSAHWIEMASDGYLTARRVQIVSVPYAVRASNAEMLAGHPASDFVLAQPSIALAPPIDPLRFGTQTVRALGFESTASQGPSFTSDATTGSPFLVNSSDFVPNLNVEFLHGLSADAFVQIGATNTFLSPQFFREGLTALPKSQARAGDSVGQPSSGVDLVASAFNTATSTPESEDFRWQSEAVGSNTSKPSGRLSLLFGSIGTALSETGFSFNPDGTANLVSNQQIPLPAIQSALATAGLLDPVNGGSPQTPVVNTDPYQWQQTPSGTGGSQATKNALLVGPNSVTLTPCPNGVNGNDLWHYLYISGTGTPEAVLITGGSCTSGAKSGTIEFSAVNSHPAGFSIGTATAGVQEAVIAAAIPQSNGSTSRNVQMSPGSLVFNARLSVRSSGLTISGTGTTVVCAVQDTCIMLGDPVNATFARDITLTGVTISSNIPRGSWPAIEDNAQGSKIDSLRGAGTVKGNSFKSLIQVDNDQAAKINDLNTNAGSWSLCDATYCSTAIVGAGPAGSGINSGLLWITDSDLSLECTANGIDNQNGNTLKVQNSVVQAYPEFGVRSEGTYGNVLNVELDDVYMEIGGCTNPLGTGMAGLVVEGGFAQVNAGAGPAGQLPQYSYTGAVPFAYYIVVHSSQMGVSPVYLAGYAMSDGTSSIPVKWNQVGTAGTITYDVLRLTTNSALTTILPPYGTGNFAVATGLGTTNCSNMVCTFVDDPAGVPSSYTVATSFYSPALTLWPAGVVLTTRWDYLNAGGAEPTKYFTNKLTGTSFVNSEGGFQPSVFAQQCDGTGSWSSIWMQCQEGNGYSNDNAKIVGTLIQLSAYGGQTGGLKGRTIYELPTSSTSSIPATEIVTWGDSNTDKTMATSGNRPSWDAADTYVGVDQANNALPEHFQLAFGAPISISNYINSVPDGSSWKERLTSSQKTFTVPVTAEKYLTTADCASSSGACGSSAAGKVAIAAGTSSIAVSTTQVTQQSEIHLDENFTYGSLLGVSCDTTLGRHYAIASQSPGIGFTIITDAPPLAGSACLSFTVQN
jgi:hypothetical protein